MHLGSTKAYSLGTRVGDYYKNLLQNLKALGAGKDELRW